MVEGMPDAETWTMALDQYRYPVDLTRFTGVQEHQGWFNLNIEPGDRLASTPSEPRYLDDDIPFSLVSIHVWSDVDTRAARGVRRCQRSPEPLRQTA